MTKPKKLTLSLEIENVYEDGYEKTVKLANKKVMAPEPGQDLGEWHDEHLFKYTGVDRSGDACYTVKITACSDPSLVGKEFETVG